MVDHPINGQVLMDLQAHNKILQYLMLLLQLQAFIMLQ